MIFRSFRMIKLLLVTVSIFAWVPVGLTAPVRFVSPIGTDAGTCADSLNPCRTIGYAVSQSAQLDEIALQVGNYEEALAISKSVSIEGGYGPTFSALSGVNPSATVVSGAGVFRPLTVTGGSGVSVTLKNLTIANGDAKNEALQPVAPFPGFASGGGGIFVSASATLQAEDVHLKNNSANSAGLGGLGGALAADSGARLILKRCIIQDNIASSSGGVARGGGVYAFGIASLILENSIIADNSTGAGAFNGFGAQLFLDLNGSGPGTALLDHITVANGSVYPGVAIYVDGDSSDSLTLSRSIVSNHDIGVWSQSAPPAILLSDNLFYGNGQDSVMFIDSNTGGKTGNPNFVDLLGGNFHIASNSAAIDCAGTSPLSEDIDRQTRPSGISADCGADEFIQSEGSGGDSGGGGSGGSGSEGASPTILQDGSCAAGVECLYQPLYAQACAGVNGFLGQINIASVVNYQSIPLAITLQYRDAFGQTQGQVNQTLQPNLKQDFIVNDLGLVADTVGSVCVFTDAKKNGAWGGGVTIYKPDTRQGPVGFGEAFDFALYYPFSNPAIGARTLPLNTFHLGVQTTSTVANWISIADALGGDGKELSGWIEYYDQFGALLSKTRVAVPDGGRVDLAGHEGLAGPANGDAVGLARFVADNLPKGGAAQFYIFTTRYFYDCFQASCTNFHTAFVIPDRPSTTMQIFGSVSTADEEIAVIEINNTTKNDSAASVAVYQAVGASAGAQPVNVAARGTTHVIVNKNGTTGFLENNTVGGASVKSSSTTALSARSLFYKLNEFGVLEYAYAVPFSAAAGVQQISEFNSFINNQSVAEVFNTGSSAAKVQVIALNFDGTRLFEKNLDVAPKGSSRFLLEVSPDRYGTVLVTSSSTKILYRGYTRKASTYSLTFPGQ